MKRGLCVLLLLMVVLLPGVGLTEDEDTMMLAKTLYTLAGDQDYKQADGGQRHHEPGGQRVVPR